MRQLTVKQSTLLTLLALIIGLGFVITSLASYYASREAIRKSIIGTELPLTADVISGEIQKDLVRLVQVSSAMAEDPFVMDWVDQGEPKAALISRYLQAIRQRYNTSNAFFASAGSQTYYTDEDIQPIQPDDPADRWFYRFEQSGVPWEIVVDVNRLTMFINYRVTTAKGDFRGVAGVGLTLERVVDLLDTYQRRYQRNIYFVDASHHIVMTGRQGGPDGQPRETALKDIKALADLNRQLPQLRPGSFDYQSEGEQHFINIRYIPELNWFLMVDKQESGVMAPMRRALWVNLLICFSVTVIVLGLVGSISRRYLQRIEAMATHDALTELLNRHGFGLVAEQAVLEARRQRSDLCVLILDLDHFKAFNDTHGHLGGDFLLRSFARLLARQIRQSDLISRWGGEEFVIMFKETDLATALALAEKIRAATEAATFDFEGTPLRATVSIGAAQLPPDGNLESLLDDADRALYRAKNGGRNRVCSAAGVPAD
ncbi:GGDEF domain-containing protein [Stutzerimonas sp. VN223-3]|uniref:sensor domain-containing diguanylate cyclase n=1 Tax=Stutzerimonas sp. VN223-3 TaxID=3384601 RepID=UPI0038B66293